MRRAGRLLHYAVRYWWQALAAVLLPPEWGCSMRFASC